MSKYSASNEEVEVEVEEPEDRNEPAREDSKPDGGSVVA